MTSFELAAADDIGLEQQHLPRSLTQLMEQPAAIKFALQSVWLNTHIDPHHVGHESLTDSKHKQELKMLVFVDSNAVYTHVVSWHRPWDGACIGASAIDALNCTECAAK